VSTVEGDRRTEALVRAALAQLYAMQAQFERARDAYAGSRKLLDDLGSALLSASHSTVLGQIELLAGDLPAAEEELRRDLASLQAMGETYLQSGVMGLLARVLYAEGKTDEAHQLTERVEQIAAPDDIDAQVEWRGIRAATLAARGETGEAAALASGAVEISDAADAPLLKALALTMLAEVNHLAGEVAKARAAADAARAIYEAKGDLVSAARLLPTGDA
jgi:ATP/maltotriose-dependent transcriptional regulator MalT